MNAAAGPLKALVDGVALTLVLFAYPPGKVCFIFPDDLNSAVGAAAVDDDVFEIRISLQQHRTDGFFQVLRLVIRRGNDRYPGTVWRTAVAMRSCFQD